MSWWPNKIFSKLCPTTSIQIPSRTRCSWVLIFNMDSTIVFAINIVNTFGNISLYITISKQAGYYKFYRSIICENVIGKNYIKNIKIDRPRNRYTYYCNLAHHYHHRNLVLHHICYPWRHTYHQRKQIHPHRKLNLYNLAQFPEHFTKNGMVSQPYKLEILHNLSLVIGSELEHHGQQGSSATSTTITEDLESDQDEDSFNQGILS